MNTIKIRTSCPKKKDKYSKCYKRKASGGWSGCIKGKPTEDYVDVLRNCVGYANGRFNEIIDVINDSEGMKYQFTCNAENFIEKAKKLGLEVTQIPSPGAIGVFQKGSTLSPDDGAGHVIICEYPLDLNPKAYKIFTSESGYNSSRAFWNSTRSNENGRYGAGAKYKFRGFIKNPVVMPIRAAIVDRNESMDQIKTLKAMNVRLGIETSKETIAYVPIGTIFNYYEKKNGKSSVWYAVNEDKTQWVAGKSLSGDKKYVEELPKNTPTPTPGHKFNIGDKVYIKGSLYKSGNSEKPSGYCNGKNTIITRYSSSSRHPYNTTGDLGWMDEESITKR